MRDGSLLDEDHWFCQGDYPAAPLYEGSALSVAQAGCGPCALTHALMSQGVDVAPLDVIDALNAAYPGHAWFSEEGGTGNGFLGPLASSRYGLNARAIAPAEDGPAPSEGKTCDDVLAALKQGHAIVLSAHGDAFCGPDGRPYESIGHYVCLHGIGDDGRILVADSTELSDRQGPLTGPANPYAPERARKLVACALAHPERHEIVEIWR